MPDFVQSLLSTEALWTLGQVIVIDLVLAGDNAVVIGLAAAGLPRHQRNKAIFVGIIAATVLRIVFAAIATQLMQLLGLILNGGILLLWVCWKMWRELRDSDTAAHEGLDGTIGEDLDAGSPLGRARPRKTFLQAAGQIIVADVSMSLDNVLAVAGAAREHMAVLVIGLVLSVALMGLAASLIARVLNKYRWIAYVGLAIILYVALHMIWRGFLEIYPAVT